MAIDMPPLKPHALKYMYILPSDRKRNITGSSVLGSRC